MRRAWVRVRSLTLTADSSMMSSDGSILSGACSVGRGASNDGAVGSGLSTEGEGPEEAEARLGARTTEPAAAPE